MCCCCLLSARQASPSSTWSQANNEIKDGASLSPIGSQTRADTGPFEHSLRYTLNAPAEKELEGTICPISFVKDTLFPYALKALPTVLAKQWDDPAFRPYREAFPPEHSTSPSVLQAHVEDLTKRDVKVAYLKNLQGYLWEEGYRSGAYSTPLFPDVAPRLKQWKEEGVRLAIYSSGSVFAQKLLFQHVSSGDETTAGAKRAAAEAVDERSGPEVANKSRRIASGEEGEMALKIGNIDETPNELAETHQLAETEDMRHLMTAGGWFDTTNAGLKTEASSYSKIVETLNWQPARTLFLTDNVKEYDAAVSAGLQAILLDRPGNVSVSAADLARMEVVQSLNDIDLAASKGSGVGTAAGLSQTLQESAAGGLPAELDGIH
ncbi:hypothetical protein B0A55_02791 [Friedmanniomyces simplex]|uniref:Enolase-phosphatase E1 n=1 Tax=Friedmanniomyces simplex TaxID=329884 RepID=A0A4U0XVK7_9PEZI|nr:hypothetical protein B0A55_02791 [Friedmanniomyces simplex]